MHFEIYRRPEGQAGHWCWRLRDATQRIIALGEGYQSRADCRHAIDLVCGTNSMTPVLDDTDTET